MMTPLDFRSRITTVLSHARHAHLNSEQVQDLLDSQVRNEINRVVGVNDLRSAYNMFDRGYVQALTDMMFETMYREDFEFCYLIEDVLYTTAKENTGKPKVEVFYGTDDVVKLNHSPSGHYWKGTDKPFFISTLFKA